MTIIHFVHIIMQLHELKTIHKGRKSQRIGRGGKRGTFCGRGVKGQTSRAGAKMMPMIREMIKRYPKLRGYRYSGIPKNIIVVNVGILENKFKAGDIVTPEALHKLGIIRNINGKVPGVKILGVGDIKKALTIENCKVSKEAKAKIEKAGGTIKDTAIAEVKVNAEGVKKKKVKAKVATKKKVSDSTK